MKFLEKPLTVAHVIGFGIGWLAADLMLAAF